ncbi:MAG: BRCT domain-containing protein [Draconibacterium sp.]|nr:BRCT domain-containing protein [Draconibacterium sp.]
MRKGLFEYSFYAKKVVFTGVLNSINRINAADKVKKLGADIDTSITVRTDFVITGSTPGPSKMKKIQLFNNQGSKIQIVGEDEFLKMIK